MSQRHKPSREKRKRLALKTKLIYGIVAIVLIIVCLFAFSQFHFKNPSSDNQTGQPKAALIDHLSFSSPPANTIFNSMCRTILEEAGFDYTYHEGRKVTVDFYRNLPTYDYSLIILRVHSAAIKDEQGNPTELIGFFTSEKWNETTKSKYSSEIDQGKLAKARLFEEKDEWYFGITPLFVQSNSMMGTFRNTVVIMMGCEGLNKTTMADALVHRKKAGVYISWTGFVSISHTDVSTIQLLQSLLQKNQTIKDAVQEVSPEPWPTGRSKLDYYPNKGGEDVGNHRIQHFISGLTTNVAQIHLILDEPSRSRVKISETLKQLTKCLGSSSTDSGSLSSRMLARVISYRCKKIECVLSWEFPENSRRG